MAVNKKKDTKYSRKKVNPEISDSILTQLSDAVIAIDNDGQITYFNKAAEEMYGINSKYAIGQQLKGIFEYRWMRPEDEQSAYDSLATCGNWAGENIHIKRNGEEITVRSSATILKDKTGVQTGILAIISDITEYRKANEWVVFQSELLNAIKDCVMAIDIEGRIIFWGNGTANMLQWQQEEVLGRDVTDVLLSEDYKHQGEIIVDTLKSGQSWSGELPIKRRDGSLVTLLIQTSSVRNTCGGVIGTVAVGKNIDELKKTERLKDEFIGLVSHELRTPLTVITGSLHSMRYPGISEEDKDELLKNSIESTESLAVTIGNMMELSRYQADKLQLHMEPVSLAKVIHGVIAKLREMGARQRFLLHIPDDLPIVQADPFRVERIVYNLLDNATKYSNPESDITISCSTDGNFVKVSITDQGAGISADDQQKLFQLFERLGGDTQFTRGLGIGLVVCKRLLESQGGWIEVESEAGTGSTFSFFLPIYRTGI